MVPTEKNKSNHTINELSKLVETRYERLYTLFTAIGKNLSMEEFEDRLEVQKIPYIAQSFGIDFGYSFSWYLKGPYSKAVTQDGYQIYNMLKSGKTPNIQEDLANDSKVKAFHEIINPFKNDPTWLEIAASLIYLRKNQYQDEPLTQIVGFLIEDMTCGYKNFDEDIVRNVISDVVERRLLN